MYTYHVVRVSFPTSTRVGILAAPVVMALRSAANMLRAALPHIGDEPGPEATWFIPPEQHIIETVLFVAAGIPLLFVFGGAGRVMSPAVPPGKAHWAWEVVDKIMGIASLSCGAVIVYYRLSTGLTAYIFQPVRAPLGVCC